MNYTNRAWFYIREEITIKELSIDTDYYFWSRKGNRFMYRAEEAVPVGFNTFPYKYTYCRDLFDYLTEGSPEVLDDLRIRMDKANEAGARVLRMVMVAGWADLGNWAPVDVPFAVHNTIKVAKEVAGAPDDTTSGTITYEAFADFMREVVTMARERDLVILPALRYGAGCQIWKYLSTHPQSYDEPGGGLWNYDYMENPVYLLSRICPMIKDFTDEPAIMAWQYINEAPGNSWLWEDNKTQGTQGVFEEGIDRRTPKRVSDLFVECTKTIHDENEIIANELLPYTLADKHLAVSGMWHFDLAGWHFDRNKGYSRSPQIRMEAVQNNLLRDYIFCRYEDFVDWHSYGFDAYKCYPAPPTDEEFRSCLSWAIDYYTSPSIIGYDPNKCTPIIFGEINPLDPKDYDDTNDFRFRFFGYQRTLNVEFSGTRKWVWDEIHNNGKIAMNSISWDTSENCEIQSVDNDPTYLRLNEHYKVWSEWHNGILSLRYPNERKMGYLLWRLVNTEQNLPTGQYDPANRPDGQHIDGYNTSPCKLDWHNIYLNSDNIYSFYLNLSKKDWGIK